MQQPPDPHAPAAGTRSRRRLLTTGGSGLALGLVAAAAGRGLRHGQPWAATTAEATTRNGMLQIVGKTSDGGLWHAIRNADGSWSRIADVKAQAGDPGQAAAVSAAQVDGEVPGGQLHVVVATRDGGLWHTIRFVNGSWQAFGDVKAQAGDPGFAFSVSALEVNSGELHVLVTTGPGGLVHTIRYADGTWQPFGNVIAQVGDPGAAFSGIASG